MSVLVILKENFFSGRLLWCLGHSELRQKRSEVSTDSHACTLPEEKGESLVIIIIQVFLPHQLFMRGVYAGHGGWMLGSVRPSLGPWRVPFLGGGNKY